MSRWCARGAPLLAGLLLACGASPEATTPGTEPINTPTSAPRYSELFDAYFAPGTPGHCAAAGCHAERDHAVWSCGPTKDACYAGMAEVGLIDPAEPARSGLVDPHRSPLTWINPDGGTMPLDAQGPNELARAALRAWVAAGAQND
jgi:hypothetical protein